MVKVRRLNAVSHKFEELYQGAYTLLSLKPLLLATALSVISWFFECFAFALIFDGLRIDFGLGYATFVYAFATLFGAHSFLPGGLGVAEGSLTGLLVLCGTSKDTAAAATLWFAVLIGMLWFLISQNRLLGKKQ